MTGFIDLHCDSAASALHISKETGRVAADILYANDNMHLSVERLTEAGAKAQFFACFTPPAEFYQKRLGIQNDAEYTHAVLSVVKDAASAHPDKLRVVRNFAEYEQAVADGAVAAFLTLEEGRPIDGKMENLDFYFDEGVRLITLTWNFKNCFGSPNSTDPVIMQEGLTPFGKDAVVYMQEKGMLVDVSHLSDGGFYDVAKLAKKPFVASHSDARAITAHPRNMTDDMLRVLADNGGVVGLNFNPPFIDEKDICTFDGVVKHAQHIRKVGGIDILALGSDFDGIGGDVEIDNVLKMPTLLERLHDAGFTASEVEQIAYKNAERVIQDTLR